MTGSLFLIFRLRRNSAHARVHTHRDNQILAEVLGGISHQGRRVGRDLDPRAGHKREFALFAPAGQVAPVRPMYRRQSVPERKRREAKVLL